MQIKRELTFQNFFFHEIHEIDKIFALSVEKYIQWWNFEKGTMDWIRMEGQCFLTGEYRLSYELPTLDYFKIQVFSRLELCFFFGRHVRGFTPNFIFSLKKYSDSISLIQLNNYYSYLKRNTEIETLFIYFFFADYCYCYRVMLTTSNVNLKYRSLTYMKFRGVWNFTITS